MKPLLSILQFALGCHHSQLSRAFTINKRTYKVCLKCGQEFDYSWAKMHILRPNVAVYDQPSRNIANPAEGSHRLLRSRLLRSRHRPAIANPATLANR